MTHIIIPCCPPWWSGVTRDGVEASEQEQLVTICETVRQSVSGQGQTSGDWRVIAQGGEVRGER